MEKILFYLNCRLVMSTHPKHAEMLDKAKRLNSYLAQIFKAVKDLAKVINKVPAEKKILIEEMDKEASIKHNTSKLIVFIQKLKDFIEDIDKALKDSLSPEKYAIVASASATTEQLLDIIKTVTKGLVSVVGPLVSTIARKVKTSKWLQKIEHKLVTVHGSKAVEALHKAHISNATIDASHPDIPNNIYELDHLMEHLQREEKDPSEDFTSSVNQMVMFSKWHDKTVEDKEKN